MTKIDLPDCQLFVEQEGEGPVLLLVHGFPLDLSMWRGQRDVFTDTHRVVVPDLRGFGKSSVTPGVVSMAQFADDLAHLLHALQITEPVVLCGLSMGGYIAWQFWERHADMLAGLVLCDTRSAPDTEEAARGRRETADRVVADGHCRSLGESLIPKLFATQSLEQQPDVVASTRAVIEHSSPEGVAAALRGMAERPDMTDRLSRIQVPALLVCGEHDQITPIVEMNEVANQLPAAHFIEVPEAGHMAPLEKPELVNRAIVEFLNAL